MDARPTSDDYPGARLGLPQHGPGSVAGWGRRLLALAVDWALSMLAVAAFVGREVWAGQGSAQWAPLAVFAVETWLFVSLLGGSAGQVVTRVVIRRTSGAPLDPSRALLRTLLVCLVIPPLVFNRDQQGLHDLAVDSVALRR
ncbi:MAG: RDD family protein [Actinomycetota bacterium]|nr:RDD family protein [Actinomycetota bacterium]